MKFFVEYWIDENGRYKINCSKALNIYILKPKYNNLGGLLCDVDLIIEMEHEVIFMEFKNSDLKDEGKTVEACVYQFENDTIKSDSHYKKTARKYYDSYLFMNSIDAARKKSFKYFYVLQLTENDSVLRMILTDRIKRKLPFTLQENCDEFSRPLIDKFLVISIEEWNREYPDFKFKKILKE
jgi:hypothetical protein